MTVETKYLNHSTWECIYYLVFTPKYRRKKLYSFLRRELKDVLHRVAGQKGCVIEEGYLMPDPVHMRVSISSKYAVSQIVGFLKGKSSIWIAQNVGEATQLCRPQVWVTGLLCVHSRRRREDDKSLYSKPEG